MGCNLCRPYETYVHVGFVRDVSCRGARSTRRSRTIRASLRVALSAKCREQLSDGAAFVDQLANLLTGAP
jgi:hypothetical protein